MPRTDAASSTPVLPRAAARAAGRAGPERSAPPPNRVFVDPGASTPISNPVLPSARLRAALRPFGSLPAPYPEAGGGQSGEDAAHARARRGGVHALRGASGRLTGHDRRVTAVGGPGIGISVLAALVAVPVPVPVAILALIVLLVLLRGLA